jgi:hypothetical protein
MDQGTSVGIFQSGGCKRCINADGKSPKSIPAQPFYIIEKLRNSGSSDRLSSIRHGTLAPVRCCVTIWRSSLICVHRDSHLMTENLVGRASHETDRNQRQIIEKLQRHIHRG